MASPAICDTSSGASLRAIGRWTSHASRVPRPWRKPDTWDRPQRPHSHRRHICRPMPPGCGIDADVVTGSRVFRIRPATACGSRIEEKSAQRSALHRSAPEYDPHFSREQIRRVGSGAVSADGIESESLAVGIEHFDSDCAPSIGAEGGVRLGIPIHKIEGNPAVDIGGQVEIDSEGSIEPVQSGNPGREAALGRGARFQQGGVGAGRFLGPVPSTWSPFSTGSSWGPYCRSRRDRNTDRRCGSQNESCRATASDPRSWPRSINFCHRMRDNPWPGGLFARRRISRRAARLNGAAGAFTFGGIDDLRHDVFPVRQVAIHLDRPLRYQIDVKILVQGCDSIRTRIELERTRVGIAPHRRPARHGNQQLARFVGLQLEVIRRVEVQSGYTNLNRSLDGPIKDVGQRQAQGRLLIDRRDKIVQGDVSGS